MRVEGHFDSVDSLIHINLRMSMEYLTKWVIVCVMYLPIKELGDFVHRRIFRILSASMRVCASFTKCVDAH